ncbi:hypothetical protein Lal_00022170 [Lupinus albus]|nr:hypothetical protein Lal_00022170 [Lupinus albus]
MLDQTATDDSPTTGKFHRYGELLVDNDNLHSMLDLKLHKDREKHGREVYTHENFYIFQSELWNVCVDCGVKGTKEEKRKYIFHILDNIVNDNRVDKLREVVHHSSSNHIAQYSCKMFEFEGYVVSSKLNKFEYFTNYDVPKENEILLSKPSNTKGSGKCMKMEKKKTIIETKENMTLSLVS